MRNIPFYASVACNDIVFAEYDENEEILTYRKTVEYSGNSTIQIVIIDKIIDANSIRKIFTDLGCESEKYNDGYFVMEIQAKLNYKPIRKKLIELNEKNKIC